MGLYATPDEHAANPPHSWVVVKHGRKWFLMQRGHTYPTHGYLDAFDTKREAEQAKTQGFIYDLYQKEGRWFRGEPVAGWKPYKPVMLVGDSTEFVMVSQ